MFSLSISFGPTGTVWAFLFKEEKDAGEVYNAYMDFKGSRAEGGVLIGHDDYGQTFSFPFEEIRGVLLEDLEQIEAARIQRALIDEHVKAKFIAAAKSDPVIMAAARGQGPGVITPMGNRGF
jgi:hypothetical protein